MIEHSKSTMYHPQYNGVIEAFKKPLTRGLTKIGNTDKDDWDDKIHVILWAYTTTYKRSKGETPFQLVYGKEAFVPIHFCQQNPMISDILHINVEHKIK